MKATNDGTQSAPSLRLYMSMYAIHAMPQFAGHSSEQKLEAIQQAGYHGVQFNGGTKEEHAYARSLRLGIAESGRINKPEESDAFAANFASLGCECATVHLGWGFENEAEGNRLIQSVLDAAAKHNLPIYPETHRATLFENMWRTLQFASHFPDLSFNADYSHWYTGSEMVYGEVGWKFDLLEPIFSRTRFMHRRISDPGCIQVPVLSKDDDRSFVEHFRDMWTRSFRGFLQAAKPGDYFCFSPEVLQPDIFYSRTTPGPNGEQIEVSDRWQQSLLLNQIALACFAAAQQD
ncbi:MAG: hypothetical protein ABI142_03715 [Bryocella sp.]